MQSLGKKWSLTGCVPICKFSCWKATEKLVVYVVHVLDRPVEPHFNANIHITNHITATQCI